MKRRFAVFAGIIVLAFFAWRFFSLQGWKQRLADLVPSVIPTSTSSSTGPVFAGDRSRPYVVTFAGGEGKSLLAWQLTIDDRVHGYAYAAADVYEAYGEVATSTDQLLLTAYRPDGEIVATATATWLGNAATGTMAMGSRTYPLRLTDAATTTARLTFERAEGRWEDAARQMSCDFSLMYPVVQPAGPVSRGAAERMNAEIRRAFLTPVTFAWEEYRRGGPQTAEQVKEDYLRACRNQLEEEVRDLGVPEEGGGFLRRSEYTSVAVTFNRDGYLSFTADRSTYTGGAHGSVLRAAHVFDLQTGEPLEIDQVIRPEVAPVFGQRVGNDLLREYRDGLFEESATRIQAFVNSGTTRARTLWETNQSGLSTSTTFYLVPTGMRVVFQQYEVTPYAVGIPEITLPFARWRDLVMTGRAWPF